MLMHVSVCNTYRYSGKTQKQIVEFVRENYVKRQAFQRWVNCTWIFWFYRFRWTFSRSKWRATFARVRISFRFYLVYRCLFALLKYIIFFGILFWHNFFFIFFGLIMMIFFCFAASILSTISIFYCFHFQILRVFFICSWIYIRFTDVSCIDISFHLNDQEHKPIVIVYSTGLWSMIYNCLA